MNNEKGTARLRGNIEPEESFSLDNFVPYLVATLNSRLQDYFSSALMEVNLTVPEWRILVCLRNCGTCTVNEIVDYVNLPQSTTSRTLSRLKAHRYTLQVQNKNDGRVANVRLSDTGQKLLSQVIPTITDAVHEHVASLTDAGPTDLIQMLQIACTRSEILSSD